MTMDPPSPMGPPTRRTGIVLSTATAATSVVDDNGDRDDDDEEEEEDDRKMNDSTMPQSAQSTLSSSQAISGSTIITTTATATQLSTLSISASSTVSTGSIPRLKVPRSKGRFGLVEWYRLVDTAKDLGQLRGQPIRSKIGWNEIQQHSSVHDGWMVLKGKVYNIGPYLAYHPGGTAILKKVLGKDATQLFDKYHRWVNEERLIGKLLIGYLDTSSSNNEDDDDIDAEQSSLSYFPHASVHR